MERLWLRRVSDIETDICARMGSAAPENEDCGPRAWANALTGQSAFGVNGAQNAGGPMLPIYYINMANRPDRRAFMERQLASMGLAGIRIEAVTEADISQEDADRYCNSDRPTFLRKRELGCTLSHERAWQAMLDIGAPAALVLEDDAEISRLLPAFLNEAEAIDADLIRIETTGARVRVYPIASRGDSGVAVRGFRSTPMGTAGYVIKAEAARRLLGHRGLRERQTDLALYNPFEEPGRSLKRVLTDPALCRQLGAGADAGRSDIAHDVVPHAYARKHPVSHAVLRLQRYLKRGVRNLIDDLAQRGRLERRIIPYAQE